MRNISKRPGTFSLMMRSLQMRSRLDSGEICLYQHSG